MESNSNINSLIFSLFYDKSKGIFTTEPRREIDFRKLVDIYQSDLIKKVTKELQSAPKEKQQELKKQLPFITPFGTFEPTRQNINITDFNSRLLVLDIDNLKPNEVQLVKFILTSNESTLLCAISPRGEGIKAFIIIGDQIEQHLCYSTLKLNKNHIAEHLGLTEFIEAIDNAQFNPTQPFFIAYDPELYVNYHCKPLDISLIPYIEPIIVEEPIDFGLVESIKDSKYQAPINYRIEKYFEGCVNNLVKFFACCSEGQRHSNIIKVQSIASWIHYAPSLEQEIKDRLYKACCSMYGNEKTAIANNVHKSFERAWKTAPIRQNKNLESIIDDTKYKLTY